MIYLFWLPESSITTVSGWLTGVRRGRLLVVGGGVKNPNPGPLGSLQASSPAVLQPCRAGAAGRGLLRMMGTAVGPCDKIRRLSSGRPGLLAALLLLL